MDSRKGIIVGVIVFVLLFFMIAFLVISYVRFGDDARCYSDDCIE